MGNAETRLYGNLWADRQVLLRDVILDAEAGTALAKLSFQQQNSATPQADRNGMEAAYPLALSAVEYFVATLQLGQALLYRLDSLEREATHTLWMRKTHITLVRPGSAAAVGQEAGLVVRLRKNRLVVKDGETWRCADVVGTFDRGEVVCSVAHRLPAEPAFQTIGADQ